MAKDTQKAVPLTEEQLIEKETGLLAMAKEVSEAQEKFVLEQNKFEEEKAAFETAKANLEAREKALEEKSEVKSEKKVDPVAFEFEGEKYQFTTSAPQHILLNGKGVSQKEIAKDDELKLQLIGGNSSLIVKK